MEGHIDIAFPFNLESTEPNVARDQFQDLLEMVAYGDCIDDGHISYVVSESVHYRYGANNEPLPNIGKWRKLVDAPSWAMQPTKPAYTASEVGAIPTTDKGTNGGVATLDESGKVPVSMLPSYVDDVVEYQSRQYFPQTGESGKVYVAIDTNITYRWGGSEYVRIGNDLALGITANTAYPGNLGKEAHDNAAESLLRVADVEDVTFPLTVVQTGETGIYEVGTSVTPSMSLSITRKGVDVKADAEVSVTPSEGVTVAQDHSGWSADTPLTTGEHTYVTTVRQGGQTVTAMAEFKFTYFRYRGEVSSVPADFAVAIKALTTKELSTDTTLGPVVLSPNKYYLFAVKGSTTFVVRHAMTGGIINGCIQGTATIQQENEAGSNTYSYVLVPASSSAWMFCISPLPAYLDEVIEYDSIALFPAQGIVGKVYRDVANNKNYLWNGTRYVIIGDDLSLGETSVTAYPGNLGKEAHDNASAALLRVAAVEGSLAGIETALAEIEEATFPLTVSATIDGQSKVEVGSEIMPKVNLSIQRKGASVAASATVSVSGEVTNPLPAQGNPYWQADPVTKATATSISAVTTVSQGGKTAEPITNTWTWTYYRYRGAIDSVPVDYAVAIKALSTKELSTTTTLGSTALAANKYYLFAVKGNNINFVVRHAQTGGIINGCIQGTETIEQENEQGSNTYSYVLIPASSSSWNFTISNS